MFTLALLSLSFITIIIIPLKKKIQNLFTELETINKKKTIKVKFKQIVADYLKKELRKILFLLNYFILKRFFN